MKTMTQSDYWNDLHVVNEFENYPHPKYWEDFLRGFKDPFNLKLLDLGSGAGRNSELSLKLGFDVYACDYHTEMVNATRKKFSTFGFSDRYTENRVIKADFQNVPYKNSQFDVVIASGVLHNGNSIQILENGISEISRILKHGGFLCLNIFVANGGESKLKKALNGPIYFNNLGLPMILLTYQQVLELLQKNKIEPNGQVHEYSSKTSEGARDVLRGLFIRLGSP